MNQPIESDLPRGESTELVAKLRAALAEAHDGRTVPLSSDLLAALEAE